MNNDPAMGDLGYEREELDFYPTPEWVSEIGVDILKTELINLNLDHSKIKIWEPMCGLGDMSKIINAFGITTYNTDIVNRGWPGQNKILDFLNTKEFEDNCIGICSNPPYGDMAEKCILHSIELMENSKKPSFTMFVLRNEYDTAKNRMKIFQHQFFKKKIVLTTRPKWIEGSKGSPRHSYSWYVWNNKNTSSPTIYYKSK